MQMTSELYLKALRDLNIACQNVRKAIKDKGLPHPHSNQMLVEFAKHSSSLDCDTPRSPSLALLNDLSGIISPLDSLTSLRLLNKMVDAAYQNPRKAKRNTAEEVLVRYFRDALSKLSPTDPADYQKITILLNQDAKTPPSQREIVLRLDVSTKKAFRTDDENLHKAANATIDVAMPFIAKLTNG